MDELSLGEATYQGAAVDTVRLTPLKRAAGEKKKMPPPKPRNRGGDMDDEIPF